MINLDALVAQTFDIIDSTVPDAVVPITYLQVAVAIYDAESRGYSNGVCAHETVAVIARPTVDEIDGERVTYSAAKSLVASDKLPGVVPNVLDNIRTEDGQLWSVVKLGGVPGESLHILYAEQTTA